MDQHDVDEQIRAEMPDFAALYGRCGAFWTLTPRLAYRLWYSAGVLGDQWHDDDIVEFLVEELPVIAQPFGEDVIWVERFAACFEAVEDWIAGKRTGLVARCTGEELAFHMIVDFARDATLDDGITMVPASDLPDHGSDDFDFEGAREALLEDFDVMMLYMPHLDGIEEQEPLLRPSRWFVPFREEDLAS